MSFRYEEKVFITIGSETFCFEELHLRNYFAAFLSIINAMLKFLDSDWLFEYKTFFFLTQHNMDFISPTVKNIKLIK